MAAGIGGAGIGGGLSIGKRLSKLLDRSDLRPPELEGVDSDEQIVASLPDRYAIIRREGPGVVAVDPNGAVAPRRVYRTDPTPGDPIDVADWQEMTARKPFGPREPPDPATAVGSDDPVTYEDVGIDPAEKAADQAQSTGGGSTGDPGQASGGSSSSTRDMMPVDVPEVSPGAISGKVLAVGALLVVGALVLAGGR